MERSFVEIPTTVILLGGIILASVLISQLPLSRFTGKPAPIEAFQERLGLQTLNAGLFFMILLFWGMLFILLTGGLLLFIIDTLTGGLPVTQAEQANWRFALAKLVATTGVLGAVVALPFTLIRLGLNRRQAETAEAALLNDKVDAAVRDLYAQRQITKWVDNNPVDVWEDDITRRNGAIDRLRGLVEEDNTLLDRVDRMLSVYVRELTREYPAQKTPDDATPDELWNWSSKLNVERSDMENAVQTLTRLPRPLFRRGNPKLPDLAGANLQKFNLSNLSLKSADLRGAKLQGAILSGAKLQGATLSWAELQGANLSRAELQGAYLFESELQGAILSGAKLQGANLSRAELQGAYLFESEFDEHTSFSAATLRGAALKDVDCTSLPQIAPFVQELFGDASVTLPPNVDAPDHFKIEYENYDEFHDAWRAFQRSIGARP